MRIILYATESSQFLLLLEFILLCNGVSISLNLGRRIFILFVFIWKDRKEQSEIESNSLHQSHRFSPSVRLCFFGYGVRVFHLTLYCCVSVNWCYSATDLHYTTLSSTVSKYTLTLSARLCFVVSNPVLCFIFMFTRSHNNTMWFFVYALFCASFFYFWNHQPYLSMHFVWCNEVIIIFIVWIIAWERNKKNVNGLVK